VAVLVAAAGLLAVATVDGNGVETDAARIQRLSDSFACPVCQGESVAESNAAVAATIRQYIADEVAAGATDEEIRDDLVRAYTVRVLLTPPAEGFASLVWILPVVLLAGAAAAVAAVVSRGGRRTVAASAADHELLDRARASRTAASGPGDELAGRA
jgi:cytochrome c-type biogenesis protein CcmH